MYKILIGRRFVVEVIHPDEERETIEVLDPAARRG